jgi:zinc protease
MTRAVARAVTFLALAALVFVRPAAAQTASWPSESPPRPLPAREVRFPPYQIRTLPNGLQVVVVLHHEQPIVSMRMIVRAGGALDPKDKFGLADLTAALLTQGTETQSATELNEAVDFIGGAMSAGAGTDLSFINMIVMKDSFDVGLRMLSDIARRPAFAPPEIERQRQQILSSLQVSLQDPEYVADSVFRRLVYGFHPYAWPQSGTPDTLARITRDDMLAFHRRHFVPNNTILAVVGDVTDEEAFAGVTKAFGDWQRGEIPAEAALAPPDPTRRIVIVNKPDAVQTEVRAGHIGIRRNHADYMPLNLATRVLGGEGANRLHQVLRTERGLTYGAQAEMNTLRETGAIEASTNTRSEATAEVLRLMVDEFWRLQRERVGERELAEAKNYMTGSFPLTIETADAIATQVLNVLFYGLPVEQLQSFRERVNAVSPDEVQRVSRFYLRPDRLSIVLVGNAEAFIPQLRRLGFNAFEVIEMNNLDLTTPDFKRAGGAGRAGAAGGAGPAGQVVRAFRPAVAYQQSSSIAPQAGPEARALLERVIAAKGGLDKLRGIRNITARTRTEMPPPPAARGKARGNEPVSVETTTYLEYPNRVRVETKMPDTTVVQVYDGARAWVKDPAGVHDVPEQALADMRLSLRRDTIAALLAAYDGTLRVRLLPDVKTEDSRFHRALELASTDLDPMVIYIDHETHRIVRQTYVAGGPGNPLIEERFAEYRPVDGVQIAFSATVRRGDLTVLERNVVEIRINDGLDQALFKRP